MSDISEHDSESDHENEEVSKDTPGNEIAVTLPTDTGAGGSADIVNELKQQADPQPTSNDKPEWVQYLEQNSENGTYTYTDPTDGTVYEWDGEKRGWIPKIDDDFIALYQANYGFTATGEHNPNIHLEDEPCEEEEIDKAPKTEAKNSVDGAGKKRKQEEKKEWFEIDSKDNNNVYVSGLPLTTTDDDFVSLMSKYGIIMEEDSGKLKIKLYKDSNGKLKGDGRCCYLKHESVILACKLLDESDFNGSTINVEQAVFELKGSYNPSLKPKKKKKKKKAVTQDKLLDWVDRPNKRSKFDRIVVLKNMFDHKEFEKDPSLIAELKVDLRSECEKYGDIKKLIVFDRNPEGVVSILFREPEFADKCIEALNGRYYAGKMISAETYDGETNYQVEESEEELKKRLDEWENFLGKDDENG